MEVEQKLENAKNAFEKLGLRLFATEYQNNKVSMEYECMICGYIGKKSLSHVIHRGQGCKECGRRKSGVSRRMSIKILIKIFAEKNAKLISKEYLNRNTPLEFVCNICGEAGKRTYASVKDSEYACLLCGQKSRIKNKIKYTLDEAMKEFFKLGLELLSKQYISFHEIMKYQCLSCEYIGEKSLSVVKMGKGCPKCAGILPLELEDVRRKFSEYELLLEDTIYINAHTRMQYKCLICGHTGKKTLSNLNSGKGCKNCSVMEKANNQRLSYEEVEAYIDNKGWTLISETYNSTGEKMLMKCPEGHNVFMNLSNFKSGKRCRKCSGLESPSLKERKSVFLNLNLILLDEKYKNGNEPLKYECEECRYNGKKTYKSAKNGYGCLACSPSSMGEERIGDWLNKNKVRYIRQYRINECRNNRSLPFDFAVFDKKNQLYCLIEFDGEQHFYPNDFFGGEKDFAKRKENDLIKDKYCLNNNINLLRISYMDFIKIEQIIEKHLIPLFL
ncbi:hypothetical protein [Priestia aryabhattai]|uniref:hypothetical protein n=1 Tax=Priestia aryabhattai TaxID=412384 RepID=UPI0023AFCB7C|nr:hypothetical protein [Priestia aryabhattai]MDE8674692.1 hypothetical protein [Priestia aryabhattai]